MDTYDKTINGVKYYLFHRDYNEWEYIVELSINAIRQGPLKTV